MRKLYTVLTVMAFCICLEAQDMVPDTDPVYTLSEMPRISIMIHPDTLAYILAEENQSSDHEFSATFSFHSSTVNETIDSIGFRLRGNTSRDKFKKSFKVSFNTYSRKKKFFGLEKLNLNADVNDPSMIRSILSWDILRSIGVPAPRANHILLYINDEFRGLYVNVEHIDEEFARLRFGKDNGNLYKCLHPADLQYLGANPDLYKLEIYGRRPYQLKTNEVEEDYTDLANFVDKLNNTPLDGLPAELEKIFNINSFLKFLAVESIIGHWDSYSYLKNNYYLYFNQVTGKFEYIPYDMDNTFGIDWVGVDWANRGLYNMANEANSVPLTQRLLAVDEYKDRMSFYVNYILTNIVNTDTYFDRIDAIRNRISSYAEDDPYREMDYNWTFQDFTNSYTEGHVGGQNHVPWGIKPFIERRIIVATNQLQLENIAPVVFGVRYNHPPLNQSLHISAIANDEENVPELILTYRLNGANESSVDMLLKNSQGIDPAITFYFDAKLPLFPTSGTVEFYIEATDNDGLTSREPSTGYYKAVVGDFSVPELRINEFMADNYSGTADEHGEFDDWIEIVNAGQQNVWLGDKYITDDLEIRNKWLMPDITLNAGEFALFWCDGTPEQGIMHTSFKLDKQGEEIGIFDSQANSFAPIDTLNYRYQQTGVSYGRIPDDLQLYRFYLTSTPGSRNNSAPVGIAGSEIHHDLFLSIYPNPFKSELFILSGRASLLRLSISDITGRLVYRGEYQLPAEENLITIEASEFTGAGMYLINSEYIDDTGRWLILPVKKVVKIE